MVFQISMRFCGRRWLTSTQLVSTLGLLSVRRSGTENRYRREFGSYFDTWIIDTSRRISDLFGIIPSRNELRHGRLIFVWVLKNKVVPSDGILDKLLQTTRCRSSVDFTKWKTLLTTVPSISDWETSSRTLPNGECRLTHTTPPA